MREKVLTSRSNPKLLRVSSFSRRCVYKYRFNTQQLIIHQPITERLGPPSVRIPITTYSVLCTLSPSRPLPSSGPLLVLGRRGL